MNEWAATPGNNMANPITKGTLQHKQTYMNKTSWWRIQWMNLEWLNFWWWIKLNQLKQLWWYKFHFNSFIWLINEELIVYWTNGAPSLSSRWLCDSGLGTVTEWGWLTGMLQLQVYNYLQSNHECVKHLNIDPYEISCQKDNGSTCVNKSYQPQWDVQFICWCLSSYSVT